MGNTYISLQQEIEDYFKSLDITVSCKKNGKGSRVVTTYLHDITTQDLKEKFIDDIHNSILTLQMPYHTGFVTEDGDSPNTIYIFCQKKNIF